jgi:hypothetical protein
VTSYVSRRGLLRHHATRGTGAGGRDWCRYKPCLGKLASMPLDDAAAAPPGVLQLAAAASNPAIEAAFGQIVGEVAKVEAGRDAALRELARLKGVIAATTFADLSPPPPFREQANTDTDTAPPPQLPPRSHLHNDIRDTQSPGYMVKWWHPRAERVVQLEAAIVEKHAAGNPHRGAGGAPAEGAPLPAGQPQRLPIACPTTRPRLSRQGMLARWHMRGHTPDAGVGTVRRTKRMGAENSPALVSWRVMPRRTAVNPRRRGRARGSTVPWSALYKYS